MSVRWTISLRACTTVVLLVCWAARAMAVSGPELPDVPTPEEFIRSLPPDEIAGYSTADFTHALAKEGHRLLSQGDYENAKAYCEYALRSYRLSFLAHWVIWRARALEAEDTGGDDLQERADEFAKLRQEFPEDPVAIFQGAIADEHLGKSEAATRAYRKLLEDFPNEPVLHLRLGVVLERLGQYEDSVAELETALELDEALVEAFEPLALGCLQLEHFDAAADAADRVLQGRPVSPRVHYVRGIIAFAQGQRLEAIGHLAQASGLEGKHGGFLHWLVSAWGLSADWGGTLALWAVTTAVAILFLCIAARERPGMADVWVAGANLLLVLAIFSPPAAARFGSIGPSTWTQAGVMYVWAAGLFGPLMIIDAIWELVRGSLSGKESLLAGFSWTWAGIMLIQTGLFWRSDYRLSLVPIVVIPIGLSIALRRGSLICQAALIIHRPRRCHEKIIAWLRAAMRIDPSKSCRVLAHSGVGDAYFQLGQYEEALQEHEQALSLEVRPLSGAAAGFMACLYAEMGRYEEAAAMHARAVELCGRLGFAALPDVSQGLILLRQGHYEAAVVCARTALGKTFASRDIKAAANAVLGYGLAMVSDFPSATEACQRAAKAKGAPTWASLAEVAMAIMWSSSGHWRETAQHCFNAVQYWQSNAEAHIRAAQAHAMLGAWDEAEASLRAARDGAPLSQFAPLAAQLLEQGKETWQTTMLPMPRPPAYPAPQPYPPPGPPYAPPPTY